ncbi:glycerol-3-phosphate 1-O-acyltransferase PlsY [Kineothrix sp. MB12-C1]|uniref:glycerol-3-phosphate 1-O-acyltransferase PlsY n=1 Tax=Kineothrix sp. MB12-C1 TaxID=3070215 RepID=UPI0027D32A89|nr:glycerol-3-phosphate 1-O-acyltransferase PlsY [Kineothrix sp. MB12-C1]WMC92675.1 glycerol-3-phosphate 1-O-acyltransferase PlsY [Kineothrix sp. MB12-C1]
MERIICLAIGYALGLFQTAYIYGKLKGIDIRQHGSGNAGTTNTLRVLGTKAGLIVFAGDVLKCIVAVMICTLLFEKAYPDMTYLLKMYAAAGAILGHNFPFYLNFKGGKGIAATAGLILSFHPNFLVVGVVMFFGAFLLTHYVSLGSLLVYAAFMTQIVVSGQLGLFGEMSQSLLLEMYAIALFLTAMAYYKHRENIVRLLKGEERKTYLFKKVKS